MHLTPAYYTASWRERERGWMTHEPTEKSELHIGYEGEIVFFHVLISPFALLKRWHLEVSFAESGVNCFQSDSSKAAVSIPLACLTLMQPQHQQTWINTTVAAPINLCRGDKNLRSSHAKEAMYMLFIGLCISVVNTICTSRGNHSELYTLRRRVCSPMCTIQHSVMSTVFHLQFLGKLKRHKWCLNAKFTKKLSAWTEWWRSSRALYRQTSDTQESFSQIWLNVVVSPSCGCGEKCSQIEWVQVFVIRSCKEVKRGDNCEIYWNQVISSVSFSVALSFSHSTNSPNVFFVADKKSSLKTVLLSSVCLI